MDTNRLSRYRTLLEEELASLSHASQQHHQLLDENRQTRDFVGPDRAAELETLEVDVSVAESEIRLAEKIQHALARIERGIYGLCERCGVEIPEARLDAKPSVSLCVACQEEHEAGAF